MKTYGSFTEMAKDTKSVEPDVLDRLEAIENNSHLQNNCLFADNQSSAFVRNFYGQGVPISSDVVGSVGISIDSNQFPPESREKDTWESVNGNVPKLMTFTILAYAPDGMDLGDVGGAVNIQTGELFFDGESKGKLPVSPADIFISKADDNNRIPDTVKLPDTIEEAIWKFVKDNINKFDWEKG